MSDMLVRIKPTSKVETYSLFDPRWPRDTMILRKSKGWYKIDAKRAKLLDEAVEDGNDPNSRKLCDVMSPNDALRKEQEETERRRRQAGLESAVVVRVADAPPPPPPPPPHTPPPPSTPKSTPPPTLDEEEEEDRTFEAAGNIMDIVEVQRGIIPPAPVPVPEPMAVEPEDIRQLDPVPVEPPKVQKRRRGAPGGWAARKRQLQNQISNVEKRNAEGQDE